MYDTLNFMQRGFINAGVSADDRPYRVKYRPLLVGAYNFSRAPRQYDDGLFGSRKDNIRKLVHAHYNLHCEEE